MIDKSVMQKFLKIAQTKLSGEWVIIGGTVMPILGYDYRVTMDIDFINLNFKNQMDDTLTLMEIAESLGLPVEAINQAGAYFLSKIDDFKENLILLSQNKNCSIYRPNVYLFIRLKINRLSETDLEDCLEFMKLNPEELSENYTKISKLIKNELRKDRGTKKERLDKLHERMLSYSVKYTFK